MNSGPQPVVGMTDIYHEPGTYLLEIPCPRTRSTATVRTLRTRSLAGRYMVPVLPLLENQQTCPCAASCLTDFFQVIWLVALPVCAVKSFISKPGRHLLVLAAMQTVLTFMAWPA